MKLTLAASSGWRMREAPHPFQQTFVTPLNDLPQFVNALLSPLKIEHAVLHIEQLVFAPKELIWYLRGLGIETTEGELNRATLVAETKEEASTLLDCALGQWADFAFLPTPEDFAIYADHDEYTTVFAPNNQVLDALRAKMQSLNVKIVDDWQWDGPHSPGKLEEVK